MPAGWTFRPGGDSRTTPRIRRQNMFCSSPAPGRKYPGTVLRNRKVQPPSGLPVYAVIFQKVQAALGCVQPFLSYAIYMAQVGVGPAAAPLHPHAFICGVKPFPYGPGRYKRRHGRGPCRISAKNPPHPSADPESTGAPPKIFPDPYLFSSCENSSILPWGKLSLIIVGNGRIFNQTAQRNRRILRMFLYIIYVFPGKVRPVCFGTPGDTMNFSGILFSRANPAVLSA